MYMTLINFTFYVHFNKVIEETFKKSNYIILANQLMNLSGNIVAFIPSFHHMEMLLTEL